MNLPRIFADGASVDGAAVTCRKRRAKIEACAVIAASVAESELRIGDYAYLERLEERHPRRSSRADSVLRDKMCFFSRKAAL